MELDPLAVIATETPQFSDADAIRAVRAHYGLDVSVKALVSERDQNFKLRDSSGRHYVLKIANAAEDESVTLFQIEALLHIANFVRQRSVPVCAPEVLLTADGATHVRLDGPDGQHIARIVSYVDGVPIGERIPTARLSRNMGISFARLGQALQGFSHPGSKQSLLWDLQQVLKVRPLLKHVTKTAVLRDVKAALDEFERFAAPAFSGLRSQVIHSDLNPDNILLHKDNADEVAGIIDFGDMLHAPLVVDVAIAACYLRPKSGDPLRLIAEFLAAYQTVTPLEAAEVDILFELIQARLCASIAILYWRASARDAKDPYLAKLLNAESLAEHFLARLRQIPRDNARQVFRQVCASAGASGERFKP